MKEIPLTKGQVAFVDDEDYELLSENKWCSKPGRKTIYAHRGIWVGKGYRTALMHRVIMNASQGVEVDHRDGNGLNNQKSNLRLCSAAENMRNTSLRKTNMTGLKGVHFEKRCERWRVYINSNRRKIFIGYFDSPIEAANAYNAAAIRFHGEFARLNPC